MGLSIKDNKEDDWQFSPSSAYCIFLDIKFRFDRQEGLQTDVNIKSTDARIYLHFSSFHPRQTFKSIVYSQCLRFRRIIKDKIKLLRRLLELKECFLNSGYPSSLVDGVIKDVSERKRNLNYNTKDKTPPNKVLWVQTFGPATEAITEAVREANTVLPRSPAWEGNNNVIGVVNRRPRNLGDLILKRKRNALDTSSPPGTARCTPFSAPEVKRKVGRPCASCNLMSECNSITSSDTGKIYSTPSADCKTKNTIYCATCLHCLKQYVGKSTNKLQKRIISGHRSHMNDLVFDSKNDDASLAEHLKLSHSVMDPDLFNNSFSFTVLQVSPLDLDACEQRWVHRLNT